MGIKNRKSFLVCPAKCQVDLPRNSKSSRDLIVDKLVGEVKESKYSNIAANEAIDCYLKEQIALIFRFLD